MFLFLFCFVFAILTDHGAMNDTISISSGWEQASYLILDCFLCLVYFYGCGGCFAYDLSFLAYMYLGNFYNNHWFRYMHFPARLH